MDVNFSHKENDFVALRVSDLEKKVEVISRWSEESQRVVNEKIDKMNKFMENFIAAKFHNLKFTLKTFVTKT